MELTRRSFVAAAGFGLAALAVGGRLLHEPGAVMSGGSAGNGGENPSQVILSLPKWCEPAYGFDPLKGWGWAAERHSPLIQSTLLSLRPDGLLDIDLADSYCCSSDGKTWTFRIRQDALFSDGSPLTASDVAFTINEILKTEKGADFLSPIKRALAFEDYEVRIELQRPCINILYALSVVGIVPASQYSADYALSPIGSGRYKVLRWTNGQSVILSANPLYYGGASDMATVAVAFQDKEESFAHACSNDLDVAFLGFNGPGEINDEVSLPNAKQIAELAPQGFSPVSLKSDFTVGVSMPVDLPYEGSFGPWVKEREGACLIGNLVTSDKAVRQAICCGIDRESLIENMIDVNAIPTFSMSDNRPWTTEGSQTPCDPEKARTLLDEAGWVKDIDGIRAKDGLIAAFELYFESGNQTMSSIAREFAKQMHGLGIAVSVKSAKLESLEKLASSRPVLWSMEARSPESLVGAYHSSGMANYPRFNSATVDKVIEGALNANCVEEALTAYRSIQADERPDNGCGVLSELPWIWLFSKTESYYRNSLLDIPVAEVRNGYGWSFLESVHKWKWRS